MTDMLKVTDLKAAYGGIHALRGVSLTVGEGEIVAVLGANGAGKSTLLKCISGVMKTTGGTIEYLGKPLPSTPYDIVRAGLVQVPEGRQIFAKLTVEENLKIGASLRENSEGVQADYDRVYSLFPRLAERKTQYGGLMSGGEQQMLAIARGMMSHPKVMMFDEPSLGLAPVIISEMFDAIKKINQEGTTVVLIEQNAQLALGFCDRAYIFQTGTVVAEGRGADLLADESMISAYLGE